MITVFYTPTFVRQYRKLPAALRQEVDEKIAIFTTNPREPSLRLHKLRGKLKGYFSFSVNYSYRILVEEDAKGVYALLGVDNHDIYR